MKKLFSRLMKKLMISCEKASMLISKSQDQDLTFQEKVNLQMHLAGCKFCRRYKKDVDFLTEKLTSYRQITEEQKKQLRLTPEQKERIKEKLFNPPPN
jgi:predicted anti-sigma-YlaC factor YlaD